MIWNRHKTNMNILKDTFKTLERSYKWIFLFIFSFGGYHFYLIVHDANESLKNSLLQANTNIAIVLENTNNAIADLYSKVDDINTRSVEIIDKAGKNRDFGNEVLDFIESSDCLIGKQPLMMRWSIKDQKSCKEWAADARKEVRLMSFSSYNEEEMISHISLRMLGGNWLIKTPESEKQPLRDWLRKNFRQGLTSQSARSPTASAD